MSKKFDNDPVTYTHLGFFGIIPIYWSEDGDVINVRPMWEWTEVLIEPQLRVRNFIHNIIGAFKKQHEPGFAIFFPRRLAQPEGTQA